MLPRWTLKALVFALPVLVVAFAVILGAAQLAAALGDATGVRLLVGGAVAVAIFLGIDALLLLALLGLRAIHADEEAGE